MLNSYLVDADVLNELLSTLLPLTALGPGLALILLALSKRTVDYFGR